MAVKKKQKKKSLKRSVPAVKTKRGVVTGDLVADVAFKISQTHDSLIDLEGSDNSLQTRLALLNSGAESIIEHIKKRCGVLI